jgi:hypothetical protein
VTSPESLADISLTPKCNCQRELGAPYQWPNGRSPGMPVANQEYHILQPRVLEHEHAVMVLRHLTGTVTGGGEIDDVALQGT